VGSNHKDSPPAEGEPPDREALGRSRGGLSTKIHLIADRWCRPLARVTTAGQRHDSVAFGPLMDRLRIARIGPGQPRTRPGRILADKAYSNNKIRAHLRRRGIKATIPEPASHLAHRARRGSNAGRPPTFDPAAYRDRNTVERTINKLRAYRAVAMRTDKRDYLYRGTIDVATIKIWLRDPVRKDPSDTPSPTASSVVLSMTRPSTRSSPAAWARVGATSSPVWP
jgi:transposase